MVIVDDFFRELICTCFIGSGHPDAFGKKFTTAYFECCNYFLCHCAANLFYFSVYGVFFQDRVVFLPFKPVGGVFPVFCRNIS